MYCLLYDDYDGNCGLTKSQYILCMKQPPKGLLFGWSSVWITFSANKTNYKTFRVGDDIINRNIKIF